MSWQDITITIASILFSYALIPQVIKGFRSKRKTITTQTSAITFLGMYTITFVYFTLKLTFSTIISFITGTIWLVLFIQSIIYKK